MKYSRGQRRDEEGLAHDLHDIDADSPVVCFQAVKLSDQIKPRDYYNPQAQ